MKRIAKYILNKNIFELFFEHIKIIIKQQKRRTLDNSEISQIDDSLLRESRRNVQSESKLKKKPIFL